jgi:N-acetylglucosamine kinase-like BadF-type ATPase
MAAEIIIALDGGGTHTTEIAVTREGEVVGRAHSGPANHVLVPIDVVKESLRRAVHEAMAGAGVASKDVRIIAGDTAGIGYLREGAEYVEGIITSFFPDVPVYLVGDMVAGFSGALPYDWGVVATAGTGSAIYGMNRQGVGIQSGGWGHILGDEGSAYDIATGGLKAAARAVDGRGEPTSLSDALPKHFGATDMITAAITIYLDKEMTRDQIAEAAVVVADEAEKGDAVARSIMAAAGRELALGVVTVAHNLSIPPQDMKVSWTGSVFLAGESIIKPFSDEIRKTYQDAEIRPPELPAVGGDVKIACGRIGWDFSVMKEKLMRDLL